jgi:hypothetical protein
VNSVPVLDLDIHPNERLTKPAPFIRVRVIHFNCVSDASFLWNREKGWRVKREQGVYREQVSVPGPLASVFARKLSGLAIGILHNKAVWKCSENKNQYREY